MTGCELKLGFDLRSNQEDWHFLCSHPVCYDAKKQKCSKAAVVQVWFPDLQHQRIGWETAQNANSQVLPGPTRAETLGIGSSHLHFHKYLTWYTRASLNP